MTRLEADLERVRGELRSEIEAKQSGQQATDNELSAANNQLKLQVSFYSSSFLISFAFTTLLSAVRNQGQRRG